MSCPATASASPVSTDEPLEVVTDRRGPALALLLGLGALAIATVAGRTDLLGAILEPPVPARFLLGFAATALGIYLLLQSTARLGRSSEPAQLVRAIRIVFLAVAAFAASAGWFVGSPVPVVAGLVIAGIDVIETTFLLLVATARR